MPGFEQSLVEIEVPAEVATSGKTHPPIVRFTGRESDVEATFSPPLLQLKRPPPSPLAGKASEQSGAFSGKSFIRLVAISIPRQVRPQSIQE